MALARALLAAGLVALSSNTAMAEDASPCTSFAWSVARERVTFGAQDLPALASGSSLPSGGGAAQLTLRPAGEVALPVPSERAAKPDTFAGFVTATVPAAGTYQVTLSNEAWIDVSQDGRSNPEAHRPQPTAARRAARRCARACASCWTPAP